MADHEVVTADPAEPLWREIAGSVLRRRRIQQGRTLADVAQQAGVSTAYLSEIERGRKEPSSEMLAAVAGALGIGLLDLTAAVSTRLRGTTVDGAIVALARPHGVGTMNQPMGMVVALAA